MDLSVDQCNIESERLPRDCASSAGHVVPDSLSASQCNLEYPRPPKRSFHLYKTSSDPHQPHKRWSLICPQIGHASKSCGRGFYDAWTSSSSRYATKAGKSRGRGGELIIHDLVQVTQSVQKSF